MKAAEASAAGAGGSSPWTLGTTPMRFIVIAGLVAVAAAVAWRCGLVPEGPVPGMDDSTAAAPAAGGADRAPATGIWRLGPDGKPAAAD